MKDTRDYGKLFLWLGLLTIFFAIIASSFFEDALAYGILLAMLLSIIIYIKKMRK